MTASAEEDLVRRCQTGDRRAFAELVELHQGRVRVFLAFHLSRPEAVDDVAQEVFLTAYRRIGTFRGDSTLRTWLHGIARTLLLDHVRVEARRKDRQQSSLEALVEEARAAMLDRDGDHPLMAERVLSALRACVQTLPPQRLDLVEEHYFRGRSLVDIATAQQQKESAVRMALLRARQALRACVERRLEAEAG